MVGRSIAQPLGPRARRYVNQIVAAQPAVDREIEQRETWSRSGSDAGIICTGETYKAVVKLTFARGASLKDP
jgi:hypothetical protein